MKANVELQFLDSVIARFGDSNDFSIQHNGTDSKLTNFTGDLQITNNTNNGNISFQCDDGSGGTTEYFKLDGSRATHDGSATTALFTVWPDNSYIALGNAVDLKLHHNGTNSTIENEVGDLNIINDANDGDIKFFCDDSSGGVTEYLRFDGGDVKTYVSKDMKFNDSVYK